MGECNWHSNNISGVRSTQSNIHQRYIRTIYSCLTLEVLTQLDPLEEGLRKNLTHSLLSKKLILWYDNFQQALYRHSVIRWKKEEEKEVFMNLGNLFLDKQRHKVVSSSLKYGGPHLAVSLRGRNENLRDRWPGRARKGRHCWTFTHFCFLRIYAPACVGKHWLTSE